MYSALRQTSVTSVTYAKCWCSVIHYGKTHYALVTFSEGDLDVGISQEITPKYLCCMTSSVTNQRDLHDRP